MHRLGSIVVCACVAVACAATLTPVGSRAASHTARGLESQAVAEPMIAPVASSVASSPATLPPATSASPITTPNASATGKIPLDYASYDGWNAIRSTHLSNDGAWLAYALTPEDGDPTLFVRNFARGSDLREANGIEPNFTADSKYVVYVVRAPNDAIHKAEREHKKPDESPKNGAAILDLAAGTSTSYARVKSLAIPSDAGNDTVTLLMEASPSPKPSSGATTAPGSPVPSGASNAPASAAPNAPRVAPSALESLTPSASPSVAPSTSPSAQASPDDLHKSDDGTDLVIVDLTHATSNTMHHVSAYAVSHDGMFVAYATASKDGRGDGVSIYALASAKQILVTSDHGHYRNLVFAPKSERLAYESDSSTISQAAPNYALYTLDAATFAPGAQPARLADATTPAFAHGFAPSVNATPAFSKDGLHLYFGTSAAPTPVPSGTPEPVKVDIWTWHDSVLQSQQRHDAERERKRSYLAVADLETQRVAQLGAPDLREVAVNANTDLALGFDDRAYRIATSWRGYDAADVYAISLASGARTLLARGVHVPDGGPALTAGFARGFAPHGSFLVTYDERARAWYALDTHARTRVDLTSKLRVAFYDELDDHPAPPPPYGLAGWLDGDTAVLVQDRYDVWAIDPRTGKARDLTDGYGRAHHLRFSPIELDPDATSFDSRRAIVFSAFDDVTKDAGYFVLDPGAKIPRKVILAPKAFSGLLKARDATRVVTSAVRFDESANLWTLPDLGSGGAAPVRVTDSNPQMARYRWGRAHLIDYKTTWGKAMRGVVLVPDGAARTKKLPMLVYFYERFSDDIHNLPFVVPAPGTSPTLVRYVSHGYVVFIPDVAYRTGHPGESAIESILPGVDAVLREGLADPKRIGIAGHSWAAYQIQYMLTQTSRFRAAEAGAAVTNMTSAYGGIRLESGVVREAQYEQGQSRIGATPWDRPDLYLANSALFHIKNVHTPYLTIANDLDGAVPFSQGLEWITAMRRLGKEAYLFSFDGEDHNLVGRETKKYWTIHLDEFFDHFLLGTPAPLWMTQGVDFIHRGERSVRPLYGESP